VRRSHGGEDYENDGEQALGRFEEFQQTTQHITLTSLAHFTRHLR
jgi:hypothetical protein